MQPGEAGTGKSCKTLWAPAEVMGNRPSGKSSDAEDMSMVLAAFARLRLRDREMMLRVAEAAPAILGQFAATDITSFGLRFDFWGTLDTCILVASIVSTLSPSPADSDGGPCLTIPNRLLTDGLNS